jgi:cysteine desulfurase/selenocysteine lyase
MDIDQARKEFGPFNGRVWLNCAHQGPLPRSAQDAARRAIREKASPYLIDEATFWQLPEELRATVASLIGAPTDEIILGNATSYGLNLLVQGLPLEAGDEVLLVDGDFPASLTTWTPVRRRGVTLRLLRPKGGAPTADELEAALHPDTRVFCCSWVFSFTGHAVDLDELGAVCRAHDVMFVVNATQGVGARPLDVSTLPLDAVVSAGFKWLCGPYATGFAWMTRDLLARLTYEQSYWLSQVQPGDLSKEGDYEASHERRVQDYDLFCTANFMSFSPWLESLRLISKVGIDDIERHDQQLVDLLVDGITRLGLELVSPASGPSRSTLVYLRGEDPRLTMTMYQNLKGAGIDVALRRDHIRISPHLYNTADDVGVALDALARAR